MLDKLKELDTELLIFLNNLGDESWDYIWLAITNKYTFLPLFLVVIFLLYKENGFYKNGKQYKISNKNTEDREYLMFFLAII